MKSKILLSFFPLILVLNLYQYKTIKSEFDNYDIKRKIDYSGVYKCSSGDIIRLNSDGTGKFIMSYISEEVVEIRWYVEGLSISLSPTDEIQKYSIFPQHVNIVKDNQGKISLSHRTMGPTFVYVKI
jgi:hypothetical protein